MLNSDGTLHYISLTLWLVVSSALRLDIIVFDIVVLSYESVGLLASRFEVVVGILNIVLLVDENLMEAKPSRDKCFAVYCNSKIIQVAIT